MALKLKYTDEHGILHINMSPTSSPGTERDPDGPKADLTDPKFDTINNRFGQYDLFGGKYEVDSGGEQPRSLFRSRYNSIEEELANTPYAFTTERSLRLSSANNPLLDITIKSRAVSDDASPSKDIEDDRFFRTAHVDYDLFGPQIDFQTSVKTSDEEETPAFTVTQLIHAQDRYFDLSSRQSSVYDSPKTVADLVKDPVSEGARKRTVTVKSAVVRTEDEAFKVLSAATGTAVKTEPAAKLQSAPASKRKKESSFAIITETTSRPASPRSLPVDLPRRISPFKGRGFREETSRHTTPKTSAANSRANSPPRRRTNSLSKIDKMATAALPPPIPPTHSLSRPHSPRNFLKENIEEVRELSELNREKHEAEAEIQQKEEEEALLREMADFEKGRTSTDAIRSVVCSRTTSRSNSPNKLNLRSRSNSPSMAIAPASVHYENLSTESSEYINTDDGMASPVTHKSRIRSVSRSQPQSNDGSPKHSKIPKRQNSVSPSRRSNVRDVSNSRRVENNLNKNQRFISSSTSSINESVRVGSQANDKRAMSKSTQFLNIAHANIKGKPPISPGRGGPPPSNKFINSKRLSPIVGTPSKSPVVDSKPSSARTPIKPSPAAKKPVKTAGNTPATSRFTSRQPSRTTSRDPSPDKRKAVGRNSSTSKSLTSNTKTKPVVRATSTRTVQKPPVNNSKPEVKKPINRTNSMKSLTRAPSTKTLNEKPPLLKKRDSTRDLRANSSTKLNELGTKRETIKSAARDIKKSPKKTESKGKEMSVKSANKQKEKSNADEKIKSAATAESGGSGSEVTTQDNETQYDKITNEKGELVILTKKNILSMTTAAITSQPLEVVTKVTNQLPTTLEKAREKGIFERHSSKDSLAPKEDDREAHKTEGSKTDATKSDTTKASSSDAKADPSTKNGEKDTEKEKGEDEKDDKKASKPKTHSVFAEDNVKLKPLLPPYNNPQVERVKQRIDEILNTPEVSTENIVTTMPTIKPSKSTFKNIADKTKSDIKAKDDVATKLMEIKDQALKQADKTTVEIRKEATKIVDSIITPVEEPKEVEKPKDMVKKTIEPIVMVVNEKKNTQTEVVEKMNEALVKGEPEVEVQSSNVSTPRVERIAVQGKSSEGSDSDKSQSNGGFPQSTSTTPKPPARNRKDQKDDTNQPNSKETTPDPTQNKPNICVRLLHKCKKCCPCCTKGEDEERMETKDLEEAEKGGVLSKLNCCKTKEKDVDVDIERAAGKASIEYENEAQRRPGLRSVICCGGRRVSDASADRRDSILSDRPPPTCCNRMTGWLRGACRRQQSEQLSASRRQSLFSKNKSLSPTLPPEDTRTKLDASLVEHTSVMRGAIPVLPIVLAYVCLVCNVVVPGLGSIFSGIFCLCFGIPRFGVHDGAKYRIGSLVINLLVGCGQFFTVLFCLVGWGWSIWWGVIMVKISRKYRKLKAEAAEEEAEAAPPVTANNHTRA